MAMTPVFNDFHGIQPLTDAGRRLLALAQELGPQLSAHAEEHDRAGTFAHENIDVLKKAGYFAAPVPVELGGFGVESAHDLLLASLAMARAEPSTAIGVNMHFAGLHPTVRLWRRARAAGLAEADAIAAFLTSVVQDSLVIATPISERNQDPVMPQVRAVRTDDGWSISGTKTFGTMSPGASMLVSSVTLETAEGLSGAHVLVPKDLPGVTLLDDWDALGMRASGSVSVSYEDVRIPDDFVLDVFEYGVLSSDYLEGYLIAGALYATAALGIAECANSTVIEALGGRLATPRGVKPIDRAMTSVLAGENAVDLFASRAALQRAAGAIDGYWDTYAEKPPAFEATEGAFAEVQAAKAVIGRAAQRVVDRSLTLSGGAGYFNGHPLARHYRDVRAVGFMHPLAENVAPEYLGAVSLGLHPRSF